MELSIKLAILCTCLPAIGCVQLVNFVYFTDSTSTSNVHALVETAKSLLKKGNIGIGVVRQFQVNSSEFKTEKEIDKAAARFEEYMKINKTRPSLVLDFTKRSQSLNFAIWRYNIPVVFYYDIDQSGSVEMRQDFHTQYDHVSFTSPVWKHAPRHSYGMRLSLLSPEGIIEQGINKILYSAQISRALVLSDSSLKGVNSYVRTQHEIIYHWMTMVDSRPEVVPALLKSFNCSTTFVIGSNKFISTVLKAISKSHPELTKSVVWFAVSMDVEQVLELVEGFPNLLRVTLPTNANKEQVKIAKTNSVTELFYLDSIIAAVKAVGNFAKREKEANKNGGISYPLDFMHKELVNGTFLGHYSTSFDNIIRPHFPEIPIYFLQPNSKTKKSAVNITKVGHIVSHSHLYTSTFRQYGHGPVDTQEDDDEFLAEPKWFEIFPPKPLRIIVVLDYPWTLKRESCKSKICNTTYEGFCIDVLRKIQEELKFNYTVVGTAEYTPNNTHTLSATDYLERGLADLAVGAFSTDVNRKRAVVYSDPFEVDYDTWEKFAFAFSLKEIRLASSFSHMIRKLKNQRYLDLLHDHWVSGLPWFTGHDRLNYTSKPDKSTHSYM